MQVKENKELAPQQELDLINKEASSKKAYPSMESVNSAQKPVNLDKWNKTATAMSAFGRVYGKEYTFPQILYHFTKDWDMFERFSFKNWYRWSNKRASSEKVQKFASDFVSNDRLQQFTNKRKKLMNRINLVRKALHELINSGLIIEDSSNKLYKIISMLEFEAMRIKSPTVAASRIRRASTQLGKLGFTEGESLLKEAATEYLSTAVVKTAAADPKEAVIVLREIKKEMDMLNYGRHLDILYNVRKKLEEMGRSTDVEAIEKIIRDDLGLLEKLSKKLTEVYTSLSKVPLELSAEDDKELSQPQEKAIEMPLEVSEEDAEPKETKPEVRMPKTEEPKAKPERPVRPQLRPQTAPVAPVVPAISREIPNV